MTFLNIKSIIEGITYGTQQKSPLKTRYLDVPWVLITVGTRAVSTKKLGVCMGYSEVQSGYKIIWIIEAKFVLNSFQCQANITV